MMKFGRCALELDQLIPLVSYTTISVGGLLGATAVAPQRQHHIAPPNATTPITIGTPNIVPIQSVATCPGHHFSLYLMIIAAWRHQQAQNDQVWYHHLHQSSFWVHIHCRPAWKEHSEGPVEIYGLACKC